MPEPLPQFDEPPVIETVLGVQFDKLPDFSPAHAGWFWRESLPSTWTKAKEVPRLPDSFERFGDEDRFGIPGLALRAPEPERIQLLQEDEERMIQIQDSKFILNWRKREGHRYPSYERLLPEFRKKFDAYRAFVMRSKLGELNINQWEITYVNKITKGQLWESTSDFARLFPGLCKAPPSDGFDLDHLDCDWRFALK